MTGDFRPRSNLWKMNLPCDADWTGKEDPEVRAERIRQA